MEGSRHARDGFITRGIARRRTAVLILATLQLLLGSGARLVFAAPIKTVARPKSKAAKTIAKPERKPASVVMAPARVAAQADVPAADARLMRAAEGAIVNIIDSYIDRKQTRKARHVYLGKFKATCYWTADEVDEGKGPKGVSIVILRKDGSQRRVRVSQAFKKRLDVEGTAMLKDGHVLNVSAKPGVYHDVTQTSNLGLGVKGRGLVPFRSIAVNRFVGLKGLKVGDRVYIPQAVGMRLPSGAKHDGYFRVDDVGSGVRGIDIYTLTRADSAIVERKLENDRKPLALYKVLPGGGPAKVASKRSKPKKAEIAQLD